MRNLGWGLCLLALGASAADQQWDTIVGSVSDIGEPSPHWFALLGQDIGYLVDGDAGEVRGTLTLSMFSPALEPHLSVGKIYSYGSYYTRTYYGDRSDYVLTYDLKTATPIQEIEIPPKSAGIGHSGMIGLIDEQYVGVWNITPATSVSIVDPEQGAFVGEISTPGCAGVYPVGRGFLMACGDGALQYVALNADGREASRHRSEPFFGIDEDPVFDYAVPTAEGWMFLSFDGLVFEATWDGDDFQISEPWSIIDETEADGDDTGWRISGGQPFAYNPATGILVTLMHQGGGQETFEDPGTEVWAFSVPNRRRGYRLELDQPARGVQLTADAQPLLIVSPDEADVLPIHDGTTGRLLRVMKDMRGGLIQNL